MVNDHEIQKAVAAIQLRSEKQRDIQKLLGSFVDVGILPQLNNSNSQVVYGRRGTGKTHVFSVLAAELSKRPNSTVCLIDARTLGSSTQFSDHSLPMGRRCLSLFRDVLSHVHDELLSTIINNPTATAGEALDTLDQLVLAITDPVADTRVETVETKLSYTSESSVGKSAGAEVKMATGAGANIGNSTARKQSEGAESTVRQSVAYEDKVVFPSINHILSSVCEKANTTLFLLIDEWSSIPTEVQPYLAEFLKRGFLPNPRIVLKIAALEYKSLFGQQMGSKRAVLGFELGADIATGMDLDDYYVFDRNPEQITKAFAEMLYRHLKSELPDNYLKEKYGITSAEQLVKGLFTNSTTSFQELVRASEGVARDLINTFVQAFFATQRKAAEKIEKRTITDAAHQWFEQDKARNLDEELSMALERITHDVIGKRKARSFLVPRELERDELIQRLFDARVLHLVRRGYADKDNPGVRYNIFTLDYGTYVDLLGTSRAPDGFAEGEAAERNPEFIVPFDDKRRIRRIILTREVLYPPSETRHPLFEKTMPGKSTS